MDVEQQDKKNSGYNSINSEFWVFSQGGKAVPSGI
jgi:hypothetical protein